MDHTAESPFVLIPVGRHYRNMFTKVSPEDEELVRQHSWSVRWNTNTYYAEAVNPDGGPMIKMHRLILDAPANMLVDHANLDGLDNRRSNIRLATKANNQWNKPLSKNSKTGYKGVTRHREGYQAMLGLDHSYIYLGRFQNPVEAALAWDEAARIHYGEFARLNFPHPGEQPARI